MSTRDFTLSSLSIYPLKAAHAVSPKTITAERDGFAHDRRWLLTTRSGEPVMLKTHVAITRLRLLLGEDGLSLSAPERPDLVVPSPGPDAPRLAVAVKGERIEAAAAGDAADAWFGELLGEAVRLVYMPDDVKRLSKRDPSATIGFAGDAPYLLICDASLAELNTHLEAPVGRDRFRANLAVSGGRPWQEDAWHRLRIGGAVFETLGPCPRCPNTTVDPASGAQGAEPLRTLTRIRSHEGKPMFGLFMGVRETGPVSVGDAVEILS